MSHYPVMLPEILSALSPRAGGVYVDGTFGAGGYASAILDAAECTIIAIDRDPAAVDRAKVLQKRYGKRLIFLRGCFGDVEELLEQAGIGKIDGFVLDLGVSSFQVDEAERGFSFRFDGPLDMRMDCASDGETAADIVNTYEEAEIANLIYKYGEERQSRLIARRIVEQRNEKLFETTAELAELVRSVLPKNFKSKIDPATRTFQGLRIAVNDELRELERALDSSSRILKHKGCMAVVSFHSLEDRIVKNYFREMSGALSKGSRHMPDIEPVAAPLFMQETRKALKPSGKEVVENARSRSARLRYALRTEVQMHGCNAGEAQTKVRGAHE